MASTNLQRFQIAGHDVALAARIGGSSRALAVYLDRGGQPTDRFRLVEAHELRRIGTHLAEIKAAIAALPEVRFPWATPPASQETLRRGAPPAPSRGYLHAHHAIPPGDE